MSALGIFWCFEKLLLGFGTDIFVAGSREQGAGIWEGGREKRKGEGDDVDCGEKFEREA
jgi:hypothetical protein